MTAASRWKRVMRVRAVEHQLTKLHLATADNRLLSLTQVGDRIDSLRGQIFAEPGATDGLTLKSLGEMATRLDAARSDMAAPIAAADVHRDEMDVRRRAAWAREEGADRLHARASNAEVTSAERRADANRPGRLSNFRNRIHLS